MERERERVRKDGRSEGQRACALGVDIPNQASGGCRTLDDGMAWHGMGLTSWQASKSSFVSTRRACSNHGMDGRARIAWQMAC